MWQRILNMDGEFKMNYLHVKIFNINNSYYVRNSLFKKDKDVLNLINDEIVELHSSNELKEYIKVYKKPKLKDRIIILSTYYTDKAMLEVIEEGGSKYSIFQIDQSLRELYGDNYKNQKIIKNHFKENRLHFDSCYLVSHDETSIYEEIKQLNPLFKNMSHDYISFNLYLNDYRKLFNKHFLYISMDYMIIKFYEIDDLRINDFAYYEKDKLLTILDLFLVNNSLKFDEIILDTDDETYIQITNTYKDIKFTNGRFNPIFRNIDEKKSYNYYQK